MVVRPRSYDVVTIRGTTSAGGAADDTSEAQHVTGEIIAVVTDGKLLTAGWDLTLTVQAKPADGVWRDVATVIGVSGAELASEIEMWEVRGLDVTTALVAGTAITPIPIVDGRLRAVLATAGATLAYRIDVLVAS